MAHNKIKNYHSLRSR